MTLQTPTMERMKALATVKAAAEKLKSAGTSTAAELYAQTAAAYVMSSDAPYAERLLFTPATGETADPDEAVIVPAMAEKMIEKVRDALRGGRNTTVRQGPSRPQSLGRPGPSR